jgi:hypothetical protein
MKEFTLDPLVWSIWIVEIVISLQLSIPTPEPLGLLFDPVAR